MMEESELLEKLALIARETRDNRTKSALYDLMLDRWGTNELHAVLEKDD
jgi:hypothetical protein